MSSVGGAVPSTWLAAELSTLAPLRLHHHADGDLQFLDYLAYDLDPDLGGLGPAVARGLLGLDVVTFLQAMVSRPIVAAT